MDVTGLRFLEVERRESGLMIATLDRPEVLNAFNSDTARDLLRVFTWAGQVGSGVRAIVLTGFGEKAFCAGADLKERDAMSSDQFEEQHLLFEQTFEAILFCPVPVIAAVNGLAFGGGSELVTSADFAYAAPHARFAYPEVRRGIFPGGGGTQMVPRTMGYPRAAEMLLSGEPIDARTALSWGLINRIIEDESVLDAAVRTAEKICRNGPLAVRQAKKAMRASADIDLRSGLILEREAYHRLAISEDRGEGIRAFNEKRAPAFKGR